MTPPPTITTFACFGREPSNPIICFVNVCCLTTSVVPVPGGFRETIRTQTADVIRRLFLKHRFHEQPADARRTTDAMRVATTRHHEAFNPRGLADDEAAIRREG